MNTSTKPTIAPRHTDRCVYLTVYENPEGQITVSIHHNGIGYQIAGVKYSGANRVVLRKKLTTHDAEQMRSYLDRVPEGS